MAKAKYHLLLCEPVDGVEAERIGLVSLCVPEDELEERALAIATRLADGLAAGAPPHEARAEQLAARSPGPAFDASLALEFLDMTGPDVHEGVAAIREKRPPTLRLDVVERDELDRRLREAALASRPCPSP